MKFILSRNWLKSGARHLDEQKSVSNQLLLRKMSTKNEKIKKHVLCVKSCFQIRQVMPQTAGRLILTEYANILNLIIIDDSPET